MEEWNASQHSSGFGLDAFFSFQQHSLFYQSKDPCTAFPFPIKPADMKASPTLHYFQKAFYFYFYSPHVATQRYRTFPFLSCTTSFTTPKKYVKGLGQASTITNQELWKPCIFSFPLQVFVFKILERVQDGFVSPS